MSLPRRAVEMFAFRARRFRRDRKASAAVEFAMIAPVFFGLLFAILDVAMIFFAGQTLETATQMSARLILTGQAQSGNYTATQFKSDFCGYIVALISCPNVYLDVESYSSFTNVTITTPISGGTLSTSGFGYNPGTSGDVVVVRAYYQWPIFVPTLGFNPSNLNGNQYLLTATAAFRNEPYANSN
jgi:Flp pilus assembly protein TadG